MATYEQAAATVRHLAHWLSGGVALLEYMLRGLKGPLQLRNAGGEGAGNGAVTYGPRTLNPLTCVSGYIVPQGTLTAHDTNYATVSLGYNDGAGGGVTSLGSVTTKITGGTGNWVAGTVIAIADIVASDTIPAGSLLQITVTKAGAGVDTPAFLLQLDAQLT